MEIFVNPFSLGGDEFVPNVQGSVANKLGLGGYHLVTKVSSEITPGSFNTNVKALFVYSGDGVTTIYKNGLGLVTESSPEEQDQTPKQKQKCSTTYGKEFQTYKNIIETGTFNGSITIEPIEAPTNTGPPPSSPATTPVSPPAAPAPQNNNAQASPLPTIMVGTEQIPYSRTEVINKTIYYYDESGKVIVSYPK